MRFPDMAPSGRGRTNSVMPTPLLDASLKEEKATDSALSQLAEAESISMRRPQKLPESRLTKEPRHFTGASFTSAQEPVSRHMVTVLHRMRANSALLSIAASI